jgi:hypothetical protein
MTVIIRFTQWLTSNQAAWGVVFVRRMPDRASRSPEQYIACGLRNRDDTGYTRSIVPDYERKVPRW